MDDSASLSGVEVSWRVQEGFPGLPREVVTKTLGSHATFLLEGQERAFRHSETPCPKRRCIFLSTFGDKKQLITELNVFIDRPWVRAH